MRGMKRTLIRDPSISGITPQPQGVAPLVLEVTYQTHGSFLEHMGGHTTMATG